MDNLFSEYCGICINIKDLNYGWDKSLRIKIVEKPPQTKPKDYKSKWSLISTYWHLNYGEPYISYISSDDSTDYQFFYDPMPNYPGTHITYGERGNSINISNGEYNFLNYINSIVELNLVDDKENWLYSDNVNKLESICKEIKTLIGPNNFLSFSLFKNNLIISDVGWSYDYDGSDGYLITQNFDEPIKVIHKNKEIEYENWKILQHFK